MKKTVLFLTMFAFSLCANSERYGKVMELVRGIIAGKVEEGFFNVAFDREYELVLKAMVHHCVGQQFSPESKAAFLADRRAFFEEHECGPDLYSAFHQEVARQINSREFRMLIRKSVHTP